MRVTDHHLATMRAQLSRHLDQHKRLLAQNENSEDRQGYGALVTGAFIAAMERRFDATATDADIIRFVADVRCRTDDAAWKVGPSEAEGLVAAVTGHDIGTHVDNLDGKKMGTAMLFMMVCYVADQHFNDAELEDFLQAARDEADYLLRRKDLRHDGAGG